MRRFSIMSLVAATLVLSLAVGHSARAAMPKIIAVQGILTDSVGTPIDGNTDITFRIYTLSGGGTAQFTDTQTVTVVNGVYSVFLDVSGAAALTWDDQYWLSVQVSGDTEMTPRIQMAAAPYALNADKIDGLDSTDLMSASTDNWVDVTGDTMTGTLTLASNGLVVGTDQLVVSGGNVGIGTATPGVKLDVSGQIRLTGGSPAAGKVLTSDATGIGSWQTPSGGADADWTIVSTDIYSAVPGNVGIGTSSPASKLDVVGTIAVSGETGTDPEITTRAFGEDLWLKVLKASTGPSDASPDDGGDLIFRAGEAGEGDGGSGGDIFMRAGGNMPQGGSGYGGLGTPGIVEIFGGYGYNSVGGDVTITSGITSYWATTPNCYSKVTIGNSYVGQIQDDGASIVVEGGHSPNTSWIADGGHVLITGGNGTAGRAGGNVIITPGTGSPAGAVGIGTSSPSEELHIQGTAPSLLIEGTSSNPDTELRVTSGGSSASGKVSISNTTGGMYVGTNTNHFLNFHTNGTSRMTIEADGDVRVGSGVASSKLDVDGVITATGLNVNGSATLDSLIIDTGGSITIPTETRYVSLNASAFQPESNTTQYSRGGNYLICGTDATTERFYASVPLPHGAQITQFRVTTTDGSSGNITATLDSDVGGGIASTSSTGGTFTDLGAATYTVDNLNESIYAYVQIVPAGSAIQRQLHRVVVVYTVTKPLP